MNTNTIRVPQWVLFLLLSGAGLTAATQIWKRVLKPFARIVSYLEDNSKVLGEIADQFRTNHGSSLKDKIDSTSQCVEHVEKKLDAHLLETASKMEQLNVIFEEVSDMRREMAWMAKNVGMRSEDRK